MEIEEFLKYRKDLLNDSKDEEGFVQQSLVLSQVLPSLLDAKLVDSEDWSESYFAFQSENLKVNGYSVNESGERLQLFIVDESSIDINASTKDLQISTKGHYENQFKRVTKFLNSAIKGHLNNEIQDADPIRPLISKVSSSSGADQFDVMEVFLISTTATVETRGAIPQPKRIDFEDETISISFTKNRETFKKEILIIKKLIDLNFLHAILISQGSREALKIDFKNTFNFRIEAIKAASEENFESYLCVVPAPILAELYKRYSSRLLEKNVRSFLQFKGANKGIRETIRISPEKFIAFNNGLTITATSKELEVDNGKIYITSLTDFQIVNGGQTTASIYFTKKDGFSIEKVKVMAKINVAMNVSEEGLNDLISDISKYSNSQTKVSNVDLGSRNPQLNKLKALSDSVMTPSGRKWFFEKSKGEFNTKLRIAGSNKQRIEKEYPKNIRFTKEQLGKYYTAWGDQPYIVKKGGEKVFRYFIEDLSKVQIDRDFYENLISKIIFFGELEKIYGQGKSSMGQIRSAVIPYSLSIIYIYTDGSKNNRKFDLLKIWKHEKLEDDLIEFFKALMALMNNLIKDYSESDDIAYYSTNKNLWDKISVCKEVKNFMSTKNTLSILEKYSTSKVNLNIRKKEQSKIIHVDFHETYQNVIIHTNNQDYYKSIRSKMNGDLSESEERKLDLIINQISTKKDINLDLIEFEGNLINKIRANRPEIFDELAIENNFVLSDTLDFIVKIFNEAIESQTNIFSEFDKIEKLAISKKINFASVFGQIGKKLLEGKSVNMQDLYYASSYFMTVKKVAKKLDIENINLSEILLRRMSEWEAKNRILSSQERAYVSDFAYGMKKLNDFHSNNIRCHLVRLIDHGFDL
jgi:hypothetical protein